MKRTLITGLACVLLLGACSSASGEATDHTHSSTTSAGAKTQGSRESVAITAKGFAPEWAIVAVKGRVIFTNRTATTQQIVFDNARDATGAALQSPPIEPGKAWAWTADDFASFVYHSPQLPGVGGRIQVDPPAEP
ncbi:MAG: hypothetical protein ACXVKA_16445 [Acidimicrobiia bacterium]